MIDDADLSLSDTNNKPDKKIQRNTSNLEPIVRHGKIKSLPNRGFSPISGIIYVLTILWITLKRMAKNWRLLFALMAGLILVTGLAAAIPIYTAAGLQNSFSQHWNDQDDFRPPFAVILAHRNSRRREVVTEEHLFELSRYVDEQLEMRIGQPSMVTSFYGSFGSDILLLDESANPSARQTRAEISFMSNLAEHAKILAGRWHESRDDNIIEVVVDTKTLDDLELVVGGRYLWAYKLLDIDDVTEFTVQKYRNQRFALIPITVTGIFEPSPFVTTREWIYPPLPGRLFVSPDVFPILQSAGLRPSTYDLQWVFDDRIVRVDQLGSIISNLRNIEKRASELVPYSGPVANTSYWLSPLKFFQEFKTILDQVSLFLFSLAAPTIGMILVYIMLIAALTVERRVSEISVLHSRGAARTQVLSSFSLEWLILAAVAALIGPYIGLFIARLVGNVQGFLEFNANTKGTGPSLSVAITEQSQRFALVASLVAVAAAIVPVIASSRHSIVTLRQVQSRGMKRSFWHRYFLDVILLGLAFYGYSALRWQQIRLTSNSTINADPILFLIPVIFFVGGGLLMLRLYPLAMSGLSLLSNHFRGIVLQLTFRRLSRSGGQYVSLLVLLILTVAMGIYNGATAHTLLTNFEDRINYQYGAELVVREVWSPPAELQSLMMSGGPEPAAPDLPRQTAETEPPFLKRLEIDGVDNVARVLVRRSGVRNGNVNSQSFQIGSITMMAIVPHEFASVAWYRNDLFNPHFYDYLIQLGKHPGGAIVSPEVKRRGNLEPGDAITIEYNGQPIDAYVIGTTPYWPSIDPTKRPFVILNLDHVQDYTALEPYDSWYKLSSPNVIPEVLAQLPKIGVWSTESIDTKQLLSDLHKEPYRRGFFGILTIGFVAAAIVAILAFMVYTIYTTRQRLVQFGALRANGLSLPQIFGVVSLEQLLTIGVGVGIGLLAGVVATDLFLPFLRDRASEVQPIPPFLIVTELTDLTRLVLIIGIAFLAVVVILSLFLVRAKLASALRLGEEQ